MTSWKVTGSAIHAALAVEELQELIFLQLLVFQTGDRLSKAQDDLANLAATCRAFSGVALNVRWRNASFGQLIQVWHARGVVTPREMSLRETTEIVRPVQTTPLRRGHLTPYLSPHASRDSQEQSRLKIGNASNITLAVSTIWKWNISQMRLSSRAASPQLYWKEPSSRSSRSRGYRLRPYFQN